MNESEISVMIPTRFLKPIRELNYALVNFFDAYTAFYEKHNITPDANSDGMGKFVDKVENILSSHKGIIPRSVVPKPIIDMLEKFDMVAYGMIIMR